MLSVLGKAGIIDEILTSGNNQSLNSVIEIAPDLYALTKHIAYLIVFKQFIMAKFKRVLLSRPNFLTMLLLTSSNTCNAVVLCCCRISKI